MVQSADVVHAFGQGSKFGFRQMEPLSAGSSFGADVQQISPFAVSHSVLEAHDFGHFVAGKQIAFE